MAKKIEIAFEALKDSEFVWHTDRLLEADNAVILWPNFSGREDRFGNSQRIFKLCVSEELAADMIKQGFNVRNVEVNAIHDDKDQPVKLNFVNVVVNMNSAYPPVVTLFSTYKGKRNRRPLDINTIGELDSIDIQTCDMVVNCYESRKFPGKKTCYLKKLNVIQTEDIDFGGKYDDWMDQQDVNDVPWMDHESVNDIPEIVPDTPHIKVKGSTAGESGITNKPASK